MTRSELEKHPGTIPENAEVEFGRSAENFPVARFGTTVLAMLPSVDGDGGFLGGPLEVVRERLNTLRRWHFHCYSMSFPDETAFRSFVFECVQRQEELPALGRVQRKMDYKTPRGPSLEATIYADGVVSHLTEDGQAFQLSPEQNAKVDPGLRCDGGWYEDDTWAFVALTFPDLFTTRGRKRADEVLRDCWPDIWERVYGRSLEPGESYEKDRRTFFQRHANDWVVIYAEKSRHHKDMIEVIAQLGAVWGEEGAKHRRRRFLVPCAEYVEPSRFGFIIDEARHALYGGPSSFEFWRKAKPR